MYVQSHSLDHLLLDHVFDILNDRFLDSLFLLDLPSPLSQQLGVRPRLRSSLRLVILCILFHAEFLRNESILLELLMNDFTEFPPLMFSCLAEYVERCGLFRGSESLFEMSEEGQVSVGEVHDLR